MNESIDNESSAALGLIDSPSLLPVGIVPRRVSLITITVFNNTQGQR
jgi:hypothetical protein